MLSRITRFLPVLLGIAILVACVGLLARVWYELGSGVLHNDALIFQTVARGYLSGYMPYSDLFETKPPGIFLIHALSWWMFDSQLLVKVLQGIALVGIPLLTLIPVLGIIEKRPAQQRQILSLLTILFGLLLSLYTANQAGEGLTESYGAFTALWFFVLILTGKWKTVYLLGLLLLISVGLKEPFFLIILAGVILLSTSLTRTFLMPLCIAVVLALLALLVTGIASPFFQVYLPHMMTYHIHQFATPIYLRMFEVWRTFINMGAYSWWFAIGITCVVAFVIRNSVVSTIIALLLMFLAIAVGGDFYGHHFIFAVPLYAVFWWKFVEHVDARSFFVPVLAIVFACGALFDTSFSYAQASAHWKEREAELRSVAQKIDTVMERCHYDRYLQMIVRGYGPYPYTEASPYGPIFVHYNRFIGRTQEYTNAHIRALQEAPLVLIDDLENTNITDFAQQYFDVQFTPEPPECAGDFDGILPYHLLFRAEK